MTLSRNIKIVGGVFICIGVILSNNVLALTNENVGQLPVPYEIKESSSSVILEAVQASGNKTSLPFNFDLIFDENIKYDDPRIKSIYYSSKTIKRSLVKIVFANPNAGALSKRLEKLLQGLGLEVTKPILVKPIKTDTDAMKYVSVWLVYPLDVQIVKLTKESAIKKSEE